MITNVFDYPRFVMDHGFPLPQEVRHSAFRVTFLTWAIKGGTLSCTIKWDPVLGQWRWSGDMGHRYEAEGRRIQRFIPLVESQRVLWGEAEIVVREGHRIYIEDIR